MVASPSLPRYRCTAVQCLSGVMSVSRGYVPTPPAIVDQMVQKLFAERRPTAADILLDPGCGEGQLLEGVARVCARQGWASPRMVGVELDPVRADLARSRLAGVHGVEVHNADFLRGSDTRYDWIIGNPPYVGLEALGEAERQDFRSRYSTARGRFDLYVLFFEQSLRLLKSDGTLVFITPEKYLYVETGRPLRQLLLAAGVHELHCVDEDAFAPLVTYPLITTLRYNATNDFTKVVERTGRERRVVLRDESSWMPVALGFETDRAGTTATLEQGMRRISCGAATGADAVFVVPTASLPRALTPFAHPTLSGRQLHPNGTWESTDSLLAPYDSSGRLLTPTSLGALGSYLDASRAELSARTCARHKPWYAWHDNLPLSDMLRPKLLCKDITAEPFFVMDTEGVIVPRHSLYYLVPRDPELLPQWCEYLNSESARAWIRAHAQRAAKGFFRVQSSVLKQLPVPQHLVVPDSPTEGGVLQPELQWA